MYSFLLDSSNKCCIIAINKADQVLESMHLFFEKDLSKILFPSIKHLLQKSCLKVQDLDFIAIGTGPGSYTGLRIGASIAKSLSFAHQIPLLGFCSLKSFVAEEEGPFISILDAKRNHVYLLQGEKKGKKVLYPATPILFPIDKIEETYPLHTIVSPHISYLQEKLPKNLPFFETLPNPHHLAAFCYEKFQHKSCTLSDQLKLLYLHNRSYCTIN